MGEVRESTGRNHHIDAFTMWSSVRFGQESLLQTDEFGFPSVDRVAQVDIRHRSASVGLDHERWPSDFRVDVRLTGVQPPMS